MRFLALIIMLLPSRMREPGARRAGWPFTAISGAVPKTMAPRSAFWGKLRCTWAAAGEAKQNAAARARTQRSMGWWRFRDSNPGPADYDSVALTD